MKTILTVAFTAVLLSFQSGCIRSGDRLPSITVDGKNFVTSQGDIICFHGLNIGDPDKLERQGKWSRSHFEMAKTWGANIIRIPVHPAAWRNRGEKDYLKLLDQAVQWAGELDLYLILDWHSIGNLKQEKYQNEGYVTDIAETRAFWNTVSKRYNRKPQVAMYEIYNEPTVSGDRFGQMTWAEWKTLNEELIDIIRTNDPGAVALVAGFNWAYDLTEAGADPVDRPGIAYVSHPYPEKRPLPWEPQWQKDWGFMAEKYPVILTEIGFATPEERGVHVPVHGDETYGKAIVDFSAERGISWVGWCFDPEWAPVMFFDWDYTPSRQGAFFRRAMLELNGIIAGK